MKRMFHVFLLAMTTTGFLLPSSALAVAPSAFDVAPSAIDLVGVTIQVVPAATDVLLGEATDLSVVVTNNGSQPTAPIVVHLDITDPTSSTSVDPEDWTSTLSRTVGSIAPGATTSVAWTIQPISGGTFALYAVAIIVGADSLAASNVVEFTVADQRSLNPGGILPVALGVPAAVGLLLLIRIRPVRRGAGPRG